MSRLINGKAKEQVEKIIKKQVEKIIDEGVGPRRSVLVRVRSREAKPKGFLTQVLGEEPDWLPAARAFAAKVNGKQLATIARFPLIKAIRPNRQLSMRMAR